MLFVLLITIWKNTGKGWAITVIHSCLAEILETFCMVKPLQGIIHFLRSSRLKSLSETAVLDSIKSSWELVRFHSYLQVGVPNLLWSSEWHAAHICHRIREDHQEFQAEDNDFIRSPKPKHNDMNNGDGKAQVSRRNTQGH